jgi:hypothetical protein
MICAGRNDSLPDSMDASAVADGAVDAGAVADGAVADGAVADGAVADGAVADGAVDLMPNTGLLGAYSPWNRPLTTGSIFLDYSDVARMTPLVRQLAARLKNLRVEGVPEEMLPNSLGSFEQLEMLCVWQCNVLTSLPDSVTRLYRLTKLVVRHCHRITMLPNALGHLAALEKLVVEGCPALWALPESLGQLQALTVLELSHMELTALPESLGQASTLQTLYLESCDVLETLPDSVGELSNLAQLSILSCPNMKLAPSAWLRFQFLSNPCMEIDGTGYAPCQLREIYMNGRVYCNVFILILAGRRRGRRSVPGEIWICVLDNAFTVQSQ